LTGGTIKFHIPSEGKLRWLLLVLHCFQRLQYPHDVLLLVRTSQRAS